MLIINYSPQEFAVELNEAANEADPWIDPRGLSGDYRRDLKARIEDGSIQSIRAWVTMLGDEPNARRIRPTPGRLGELMGGRAAIAVVKNHSRDVDHIIGRVEQTRVRARASDGVEQLQGLHRFNDKGAMSAFVDGNMTDFSVGLRGGKAPLVCSGCEKEAHRGLFGALQFSCNCDGAELFIPDAMLLHNAWVTEGAYRDTGFAQNNSTKDNPILHLVSSKGPCGCQETHDFGATLSGQLDGAIERVMERDDISRADVIARMASAAGIEPSTVNQILTGSINCPPLDRLRGFARVLPVSAGALQRSAEEDGCTYNQDNAMPPTVEQLSADLASANATILARDERILALEDIVFEEVFRGAVSEHRVTPAQQPTYDKLRAKAGLDFAMEMLSGLTPREDMPATPQGRPPVEAQATPDETAGDKTYGYKVALAAGTITKEQYERFTA